LLCVLIRMPSPSTATFFPYTTLFRSEGGMEVPDLGPQKFGFARVGKSALVEARQGRFQGRYRHLHTPGWRGPAENEQTSSIQTRSEEHTSELQSLRHLVCRLLLEKKK